MAAKTFPASVQKLLQSGWAWETPVSVVHAVGLHEQQAVFTSTLGAMAAETASCVAVSPCVIIVGQVVLRSNQ